MTAKTPPTPRRALGRGLDALLPPIAPGAAPVPALPLAPPPRRDFLHCPVDEIRPAPDQPRRRFSDDGLASLAATIREHGVVQPLLVRRERGRDGFVIIAGERRWRAAQRAGLREVPIVVKEAAPREAFELALIENLQREDLDPLEEAEAFSRLASEHGLSQDAISARVGKDRSTV
ncbi:MAG: ParB/RepB/Spo0J family partition protein, partial [Myxococcota bacterium]